MTPRNWTNGGGTPLSAANLNALEAELAAKAEKTLATAAADGLMPKADKSKLDAATSLATPLTVALRNSAGTSVFNEVLLSGQTTTVSATRKDYVDGLFRASTFLSTGSLNGVMSAADKAKLDAATANETNNTLVMRDSQGNVFFGSIVLSDAPAGVSYATRKDYVDAQVATRYSRTPTTIPTAIDLDTYLTADNYHQGSNASAAAGSNYPVPLAGLLEVYTSGSMVYQRYTTYNTGTVYSRARYASAWSPWLELGAGADTPGTASNPMTSAAAARPTGLTSVWWLTPTQPTNWTAGDVWVVTP